MCAGHPNMGSTARFQLGFPQGVPRLGCRNWAEGAVTRFPVTGQGRYTGSGEEGVPVKGVWPAKVPALCSPRICKVRGGSRAQRFPEPRGARPPGAAGSQRPTCPHCGSRVPAALRAKWSSHLLLPRSTVPGASFSKALSGEDKAGPLILLLSNPGLLLGLPRLESPPQPSLAGNVLAPDRKLGTACAERVNWRKIRLPFCGAQCSGFCHI